MASRSVDPFLQVSHLRPIDHSHYNSNGRFLCYAYCIMTPCYLSLLYYSHINPRRAHSVDSRPADCSSLQNSGRRSSILASHAWSMEHTHSRLTAFCPGLPGWAGTRKVKPIWIFLKQEIVSSSGISWAICKSALRSRQTTTPAPHHSVSYRLDAFPATQPTASKHWRLYLKYGTVSQKKLETVKL